MVFPGLHAAAKAWREIKWRGWQPAKSSTRSACPGDEELLPTATEGAFSRDLGVGLA